MFPEDDNLVPIECNFDDLYCADNCAGLPLVSLESDDSGSDLFQKMVSSRPDFSADKHEKYAHERFSPEFWNPSVSSYPSSSSSSSPLRHPADLFDFSAFGDEHEHLNLLVVEESNPLEQLSCLSDLDMGGEFDSIFEDPEESDQCPPEFEPLEVSLAPALPLCASPPCLRPKLRSRAHRQSSSRTAPPSSSSSKKPSCLFKSKDKKSAKPQTRKDLIRTPSTPVQKASRKRMLHSISEKKRRHSLKSDFELLRQVIPSLQNDSSAPSISILRAAIDYIQELRAEEALLIAQKKQQKKNNA